MRIKLDENLPATLAAGLGRLGHDADTVPHERLGGRDDPPVWQAAQATERFLVTQDLDFSDVRVYTPGTPHGILLVRLRNPLRTRLMSRILQLFQTEDVESWKGAFVVTTESKLCVRGAAL